MIRRCLDIVLSVVGLLVCAPLLCVITGLGWWYTRSPFFAQARVGRNQQPFTLLKFRTMWPGTATLASHLVDPSVVTPFGRFLRRTKLDELPQLWNVIKGEMSLVGPRPCLLSQVEVIAARAALRVFAVRPGLTGLAQIRGIDMSTPQLLAETDAHMIRTLTVRAYFQYLFHTVIGKGAGDRVQPIE